MKRCDVGASDLDRARLDMRSSTHCFVQKYNTLPARMACVAGSPQTVQRVASIIEQVLDRPASVPASLDVPLMLAFRDSSKPSGSLRIEVEQLATGSFEPPAASAFVSLLQLPPQGPLQPDAAAPAMRETTEKPTPLAICQPVAIRSRLPSFLVRQDAVDSAVRKGSAAWRLPRIDAPVLVASDCTLADGRAAYGAPLAAFPDEFQPVPVPTVGSELSFAPLGCTPLSLPELLARDLVLDDDGLVLPAVDLDDSSCEVQSSIAPLMLIASDCGATPASASHLALYLDWWVLPL